MTRRRLYSGLALGSLFFPACSTLSPQTVMVPMTPPGTLPPSRQALMPMPLPVPVEDQFASHRIANPAPIEPARLVKNPASDSATVQKTEIEQVQHRDVSSEPVISPTPRLNPPAIFEQPKVEPVVDADGIVRPSWPVIQGSVSSGEPAIKLPSEQSKKIDQPIFPSTTPRISRREPTVPSAMLVPPSPLSESVIGSSAPIEQPGIQPPASMDVAPPVETINPVVNVEKPAPTIPIPNFVKGPAPIIAPTYSKDEPVAPAPVALPLPSDTAFINAIRSFQQNKPQEALEFLKAYDQQTQQVLMSMMPVLVQLSEGKLQQMKREEMDILLDQLTRVPPMLRSRASLQATRLLLCREVQKFGVVDAFPAQHEFRAGDMVYLYAELSNFTCSGDSKEGYSVTLSSHLELKDATNTAVWKADPREEPEHVSTPPQDYYRAYRFCVPNTLRPGNYLLSIRITDKPTGRETTKEIEFRVSAK